MTRLARGLGEAILLAVLAISIPFDPDHSAIPFTGFWGSDFQNLWAFHHCSLRNTPYARPDAGAVCGDLAARSMNYPPLLYWSFIWTRALSFGHALRVWIACITLALMLALFAWHRSAIGLATSLLLLLHFPFLFAVERGNNDVAVVVLWALALIAWKRGSIQVSGFLCGVAVAAKIYPLFAVAVLIAGIKTRGERMRFGGGALAALLLTALLFLRDSLQYLPVLRAFAAERPSLSLFGHGLPTQFPAGEAMALSGLLILSAALGARRALAAGDPMLAFALALAMTTFFGRSSFDYNLVTTYPLLVLWVERTARAMTPARLAMASALILTLAGARYPFRGMAAVLVLLEVLSLAVAAIMAETWVGEVQEGGLLARGSVAPTASGSGGRVTS